MPVSEKDDLNLGPGEVNAKAPLKKSTVAWAVGIVMGLVVVGYYAPKMFSSPPDIKDANVVDKAPPPPKDTITGEFAKPVKVETIKPGNSSQTAPIPESADPNKELPSISNMPQPVASSAPGVAKPGNMPVPLAPRNPNQLTPEEEAAKAQLERDAAGRASKSLITDDTKAAGNAVAGKGGQNNESTPNDASPPARPATDREALLKTYASAMQQSGPGKGSSSSQNADWLKEFGSSKPAEALKPKHVASQYILTQGKVIPAVLGKSLNSDLPGDITAYTTMDIYDSIHGSYLLIPKGSTVVGEYSSNIRPGQERLMFAFNRIILPNGLTFDLPGNKGQDQQGMSGVTGDVNSHFFKRFANAFLIAILADASEKNVKRSANSSGSGPQTAAGQVLSDIAKADLGRNVDIPPTITIEEGTRINIQVSSDMEFPKPYSR